MEEGLGGEIEEEEKKIKVVTDSSNTLINANPLIIIFVIICTVHIS